MTYIWKTYPGISHRDPNQPGCVPSLSKPQKSGVQAVAGGRWWCWCLNAKNGQTRLLANILFDYCLNASTVLIQMRHKVTQVSSYLSIWRLKKKNCVKNKMALKWCIIQPFCNCEASCKWDFDGCELLDELEKRSCSSRQSNQQECCCLFLF